MFLSRFMFCFNVIIRFFHVSCFTYVMYVSFLYNVAGLQKRVVTCSSDNDDDDDEIVGKRGNFSFSIFKFQKHLIPLKNVTICDQF
jgi:hypothetical protein